GPRQGGGDRSSLGAGRQVGVLGGRLTLRDAPNLPAVQVAEDDRRQLCFGLGLYDEQLRLLSLLDRDAEDAVEPADALDSLVFDAVDLDLEHVALLDAAFQVVGCPPP